MLAKFLRILANFCSPLRIILNYNFETGSMTGILEHFKWESLKNGGDTVVLLYKGLKGFISSFSPKTIRDWNALPLSYLLC